MSSNVIMAAAPIPCHAAQSSATWRAGHDAYAEFSDYVATVNHYASRFTDTLVDIHASQKDLKQQLDEFFIGLRTMEFPEQRVRQVCNDILICCSSKLLTPHKGTSGISSNLREEFSPARLFTVSTFSGIQQVFTDKLLRIHGALRTSNNTDAVVEVLDYLLCTQCSKVTLQYVSEYLGISASYLSFMFKKKTQINFRDYVHQYKMEKAADYLRNTQILIQQIALQLGYNDIVNFSRVFKKHYNISPSGFRAAATPKSEEA